MAWFYLLIAGISEIIWAVGLKYSEGFTKLYPTIITIAGMIVSFYFLALSLKTLPIGTAYAIWTGIGAIGAVVVGMIVFNEPRHLLRIVFVLFILTGIIGLKVTAGNQ